MNAESVYKVASTVLIGIVLTLAGAWMTVNASAVTKDEVREMIQPDRDLAKETFSQVKQLREEVSQLSREIGELKGMLAIKK